jgi:transcriptional regulator with XRE-family HTH domain
VENQGDPGLAATRFGEIINFALRRLGHGEGRASQRDLAAAIGVAPTMVGRYRAAAADFEALRAVTVERLAAACGLEVGALFAWIREGREAAMAYQQRISHEPVAFEPIDLARQLVALLEQDEPLTALERQPDYGALQRDLADARAIAPALFDRLVQMTAAAPSLEKVEAAAELDDQDWLKLQQLLDAEPAELQERYGFAGRISSRTPQHCA